MQAISVVTAGLGCLLDGHYFKETGLENPYAKRKIFMRNRIDSL